MKEAHWRVGQWKCHLPENLISILSESANEALVCTGSLSQDDHVLNRLPLLKYSWAEIYSLIFHYLLSLYFAYIKSLELVLDTITFILNFIVGGVVDSGLLYCLHAADNKSTLILEGLILSSLCLHWKLDLKFSQATSQTVRPRGFQAHGLRWERSSGDHTSGGSLRLNRITTTDGCWCPYKQALIEGVQLVS